MRFSKPKVAILLTEQELEDIRSAISFFAQNWENHTKQVAPQTLKAMERLDKKMLKNLNSKEFK